MTGVAIIWCVTMVLIVLIAVVTVLVMEHQSVRNYRQIAGTLMDPEWDSWLERHHLARKTR